jgi:hypothetical protein
MRSHNPTRFVLDQDLTDGPTTRLFEERWRGGIL